MAAMPIFDGVDDAVEYIYNYVMVSSDEEKLEFVLAALNFIYTLIAIVSWDHYLYNLLHAFTESSCYPF